MSLLFSRLVLIVVFCFFSLLFSFFTEMGFFDRFRIPIGSLFAGLLALTGLLFASRTFITFKLNEVIYGSPTYRSLVEQLKRDGAYDKELYDPLKKLDSNLGLTSYFCLLSLLLVMLLSFFPEFKTVSLPLGFRPNYLSDFVFSVSGWQLLWQNSLICSVFLYKVFSSLTLAFLVVTGLKIVHCISSVNENIKNIIEHWEDDYKKTRATDDEEN